MHLKTIFLFVVLASVGLNAQQCDKEKVKYCKGWLIVIDFVEPSFEGYMYLVCRCLRITTSCLDETVAECRGEEINQEIEEARRKLIPIEEMCFRKEPEIPENMEKCARSIQKELNKCVNDIVDEVLGRKIAEQSLDKIRCSIYEFIFKCVVQKDEDSCGKAASQMALEQMFDLPEEIQENCGNSAEYGTLRELAHDTVTESATTNSSLLSKDASVGLNAKQCYKEKVKHCKGWLSLIDFVEPSYDIYMYLVCRDLRRYCLDAAVAKCRGKRIHLQIEEKRRKLIPIVEMCFMRKLEIPEIMEKCARSIRKELNKCVNNIVDVILRRKLAEQSLDKIRCSIYEFIFKCVVQKDEDSCGKAASQMALEQMFDLPEEIQENCGNSAAYGTLRELAHDTVTESATTNSSLLSKDDSLIRPI